MTSTLHAIGASSAVLTVLGASALMFLRACEKDSMEESDTGTVSAPAISKPAANLTPMERQKRYIASGKPATKILLLIHQNNDGRKADQTWTSYISERSSQLANDLGKKLQERLPAGGVLIRHAEVTMPGSQGKLPFTIRLDMPRSEANELMKELAEANHRYSSLPTFAAMLSDTKTPSGKHRGHWEMQWSNDPIPNLKDLDMDFSSAPTGEEKGDDTSVSTTSITDKWNAAAKELDSVTSEFALFEFGDPELGLADTLITRQLLQDYREPATAWFYDAYNAALRLKTSTYPGDEHAYKFVSAVEIARNSWDAADDNARRKGEQNIGFGSEPLDSSKIATARSSLELALRSDSDNEASLSWNTALSSIKDSGIALQDSTLRKLAAKNEVVALRMKMIEA